MNNHQPVLNFFFVFSIIGLMFVSCNEPPLIYTHPDWLGGSNIETLEKEGDCSIFLALMDKAGYRLPIEKQLFALFVPRDEAFEDYFAKKGINSVDNLSDEEAFRLFTMFVLPNPLSRYQIIYDYAWDLESPEGEYGALFLRKRTRSKLSSYKETPLYHPIYSGQELTIETNIPIWVPFFTTEFMEDYFAAPDGSDYEFLCRGSHWSGTQWHDAMVTDAEVRTSNGFIYYLDRVVDQHPTADRYLKDKPEKYSTFYDMIQPFATYVRWENDMNEIVYRKGYNQSKIFDIANPEGPNTGGGHHTKRQVFTLFMPSNEAWNEYFANNNIDNFEDLSEITRIFLIQSHILNNLALKSKIDRGLKNSFGDPLDVNTETDITDAYLCNNAAVYDINRVLEPFAFQTVTGPIFLDQQYSTFLLAVYLADKMNLVSNKDIDVTVFPITNEQFAQIGVRYNEEDNQMQFLTSQERWVEFTANNLEKFIEGFIVKDKLTDLNGEGYVELVSGEYMYYNENKLFSAGNTEDNDYAGISGSYENDINGMLYYLDNPLKASQYTTAEKIQNDPDLQQFFNLLLSAQLVTTTVDPVTFETVTRINFLRSSNDWTIFVPTNEAVINAMNNGQIPTEQNDLRNFIYNHVLRQNVIFDDGKKSGSFNTRYTIEVTDQGPVYSQININNSYNNMVITDPTGQIIEVSHQHANTLVEAGVMHKITSVILLP